MALATSPARLGQVNKLGDDRALFKKIWLTEVLGHYSQSALFRDKVITRTIQQGKSASFPIMGPLGTAYHTVGENILDATNGYMQTAAHAERIISIDGPVISPVFIADIDAAMSHIDYRSEYTREQGIALASKDDSLAARTILAAARYSTPDYTGARTGTVLKKGATVASDGEVLTAAIQEAVKELWTKNIPKGETVYCAVRPDQYLLLTQNKDNLNRDWNGTGSYSELSLPVVGGARLVMTNSLPSDNYTKASAENGPYTGNNTDTVAVVWTRQAVGKVVLRGLAMDGPVRKEEYMGDFINSYFLQGYGILRPECAVEISKETP